MQTKLFHYLAARMSIITLTAFAPSLLGCHSRHTQHLAQRLRIAQSSIECSPKNAPITRYGPEWARGMVWYQIFPERFSNGNPKNDPIQLTSTLTRWNHPFDEPTIEEIERQWFLHQGEPGLFHFYPQATGGVIANVITQRRYGGDLQGVLQHLDTLVELGVDGIYLCPIFTSTSLHKYDAADHRHIDPTLANPGALTDLQNPILGDPSDEQTWGWSDADRWFLEVFVPAVHERGLKLMLDGVWNHVGVDHWAFQDVRKNGESSPFADWFDVRFNEDGELIWWKSWNGENGRLPVFLQTESGDLAPGPKAHMTAVTRRWMDPNGDGDPSDGIDGWRLDVANEIGRPFWKDWRRLVKDLNPNALIVGEIWHDAREYFDGTAFDAQMNYPAAYPVADWLSIGHMKDDTRSLAARLTEVYSHAPEIDACQLNLLASHDTERIVSLMHNHHQRSFDNGAHPWRNADTYDRHAASDNALVRSLVAYMVMIANPGSVMIYNGDEFAMIGADDPDDRRPIPEEFWDEWELDPKRAWFQNTLRELLSLTDDPSINPFLTIGDARWSPSLDARGLRIVRTLGPQSLNIDIGPTGTQWHDSGGTHIGDPIVFNLNLGSSDWTVRLQRMED